jgi:heteromeric Ino2p/Ino4p transcription factor
MAEILKTQQQQLHQQLHQQQQEQSQDHERRQSAPTINTGSISRRISLENISTTSATHPTNSNSSFPNPLPPPPIPRRTSEGSTTAATSPQDYYSQHSVLLSEDHFAPTSWSPQSASSSLPAGNAGEDSRAQSDPLQNYNQESAAPGTKRKHIASIDPQLQGSDLSPTAGNTEQPAQTQQPKKQRRTSKAKARSGSIGEADQQAREMSASAERPRLTEQEKKNNHIASEQKRREAIRQGFDRLTEIVPGLEGQGRSESIVLKKCWYFP